MKALVIDPGRTSGILHVTENLKVVKALLATDLGMVLSMFQDPDLTHVVVEDFVGSGPRNSDAIFVLKLVGSIEAMAFLLKLPLIEHAPQKRIPYLADSKRMMGDASIHLVDAYAHALVFYERKEYVTS